MRRGRTWRMTRLMSRRRSCDTVELTVAVAEEDDFFGSPEGGGRLLLGASNARNVRSWHVGVEPAGVPVGDDAERDGDPQRAPGRQRAGRPEVAVVRVCGHDEDTLDLESCRVSELSTFLIIGVPRPSLGCAESGDLPRTTW